MTHHKDIDALVNDLVMSDDMAVKQAAAAEILAMAKAKGIYLASIHNLYKACGERKCPGFTVPAINLRCLTYYLARAIFRVAKKNNAGAFIFEIAKSEMGYTDQKPVEYTGVVLAAAVKEGYTGPVFIQGDHFQAKAKSFVADPKKELDALRQIINDAVAGGFFNIDIDTSTLVDLDKPTITEQQRANFESCAALTEHIRKIQPKGMTISVGGEIGEVGKKNSTVEELKGFMDGYMATLQPGLDGMSKISIQTGTSHGGVVLPDGTVAQVNVDFETLKKLSNYARDAYQMGGAVQHGASTLPASAFSNFPQNDTLEIHLATNFQNMMYDSALFPQKLKEEMYAWLHKNCAEEKKEGQTDDQFIYKTRKKALGPFKKQIMGMPDKVKEGIAQEIEANFDFLFKQLKAVDTKKHVEAFIKPVEVHLDFEKGGTAVLDGEGDD